MEVTSRNVQHGSYLLERTPWKLPVGTYTMRIISTSRQSSQPTITKVCVFGKHTDNHPYLKTVLQVQGESFQFEDNHLTKRRFNPI